MIRNLLLAATLLADSALRAGADRRHHGRPRCDQHIARHHRERHRGHEQWPDRFRRHRRSAGWRNRCRRQGQMDHARTVRGAVTHRPGGTRFRRLDQQHLGRPEQVPDIAPGSGFLRSRQHGHRRLPHRGRDARRSTAGRRSCRASNSSSPACSARLPTRRCRRRR